MNPPSEWMPCLETAGLLALEAALVIGIAAAVQPRLRSALWHRNLWQGVVLALVLVFLAEISGLSRDLGSWMRRRPVHSGLAPARNSDAVENADRPLSAEFRARVQQRLGANQSENASQALPHDPSVPGTSAEHDPASIEPFLQGHAMPWPELIWTLGTGATLGLIGLARALFACVFRRTRRAVVDAGLQERIGTIGARVGLRRRVRVFESSRLRAPVAFGVVRPTIGLPKEFTRQYSLPQQDVMLAHELAHLAGHDAAWQWLADATVALFWWHPMVWWARHRLRAAAETAADEASMVVTGGPRILAECLVTLAAQVARRQPLGWAGATGPGFRSGLGRRIERLLRMREQAWSPWNAVEAKVVKLAGSFVLLAAAIACTAWVGPQKEIGAMKTLKQTWNRSLATLTLFAAIGTDSGDTPLARATLPPNASIEAGLGTNDTPAAANGAPTNQLLNSPSLVRDGRLLIEMGHLDEAEQKLTQALRSDPANPEALGHLDLIKQKRLESGAPAPSNSLGAVVENTGTAGTTRYQSAARYGMLGAAAALAQAEPTPAAAPAAEAPEGEASPEPEPNIYRMDPRLLERYGLKPRGTPPVPRSAVVSRGKQQIEAKLNQIILNEVDFDGQPLADVVKNLQDEARKRDPAKRGLNIIVSNVPETPLNAGGIDPTTGMPLPPQTVELANVPIKLHLRDVRLKDVLDAMARVADQPIRYSVEEYGVLFSPGSGQPFFPTPPNRVSDTPRLQVRTFRVDTNTFVAGLESAFGVSITPSDERAAALRFERAAELRVRQEEAEIKALEARRALGGVTDDELQKAAEGVKALRAKIQATRNNRPDPAARDVQQGLRQLLQQLGINMDVPNKAIFYNELTGILMVRATEEDLELVQAAIETLGGKALRPGPSRDGNAAAVSSRSVSIFGQVTRPGAFPLTAEEPIDFVEAIARAGGLTPIANKDKIRLERNGESSTYRFDTLVKNTAAEKRIWLEPGDVIVVPDRVF